MSTPRAMNGQENQKYQGPFQVGPFKGKASYHYKIKNSDTIFNGSFRMQLSNLGALLKKQDTTFFFKGNFENNYPEGDWKFQFGKFQSDSLTELVGLQYNLKVSGVQEEAVGSLKKGKPHGEWNYTINRIKDSEIAQILFGSTIVFEEGTPQKSFKILNTEGTLVGRFLRDGLAHDEWVRYSESNPGVSESWFFDNGRLQKIRLESKGEPQEIIIFSSKITDPKIISLDQRYLAILKIQNKNLRNFEAFKNGIGFLLSENYSYYKKIDGILNALGKSAFLPEFKVKVNHFPLDSVENSQLDSISKLYTSAEAISQKFLNDTQLNILKVSDEEAGYLYAALQTISEKLLKPLGQFTNYHQMNIFEYVERDQIISQLWTNGFPSKDIAVHDTQNESENIQIFTAPNAESYDFSGNSLASVEQLAAYASSCVMAIRAKLEGKLVNEKREQELVHVEERLIAQINRLNALLDSVGNSHPKKHINALKNIKVFANANLGTYSNTSDKEDKLAIGRRLINCFDDLQLLENAIFDLSTKQQKITETYKDEIWNPFMANIMTEEVKKRITASYNKVLLPYLLESATENLDCTNAADLAILFDNTHERMLALRDEDTRKLERKLKKVQDPKEVMRLLNIATGTSEE